MAPLVLHVSETTDGGVGVVLRDLVEAQAARGWRVWVAAPWDEALARTAVQTGGGYVDWRPGAKPGSGFLRDLAVLRRLVRRSAPDLVHLHTSMAGLCGRSVVRGRIPTLFQPHSWSFFAVTGPQRQAALAWERLGARWAHAVLCVSQDEREHAVRAGVRGRFVVVPNGVHVGASLPDRGRARQALHVAAGTPLVVCVGRLHRQKGQHLLLDAWPAVLREVPEAQLALVGDGPDRSSLVARRPQQTTFVGRTDDVATWLAAADVVVQPSVWEGMSLSLLEAMAAGRSVVVTDVPGMREVVSPQTGAVVPREAAHLAEAVVRRLRDPALTEREGQQGRRLVQQRHDVAVQRERVLELVDQLRGCA